MEDCRLGFGDLKLLADGGGVDSPKDDMVFGDSTGDDGPLDTLLSSSCNGRGPTVGEEAVAVADTTALIL